MEKIKIAIQKKGRLSEKSLALLAECGIRFENGIGSLSVQASNFPIEILLLRDDDIPEYVQSGVADLGIVGQNVVLEKTDNVKEIKLLGFGKCRFSLAVGKKFQYNSLKDLEGKQIATSYPKILSNYLKLNDIDAKIHIISGSVEIAPSIGLADAICDIVSTGSTLLMNGLKEVETILHSQAVLIANKNLNEDKKSILAKLLFRLEAVQKAKNTKYILLNVPNNKISEISKILPGMKSPTIMPLQNEGWSSLHSVIEENDFWEVIEKLQAAGAQGILVMPIEKMII